MYACTCTCFNMYMYIYMMYVCNYEVCMYMYITTVHMTIGAGTELLLVHI